MNLNISVDDILMTTAIKFGGLETQKDTVNAALEEFIETGKRMDFYQQPAQLILMMTGIIEKYAEKYENTN